MIQVNIEIAESDRANSDNSLSCQVYDAATGRHMFGGVWVGGTEDGNIVGNPRSFSDPISEDIFDVDIVITTTNDFQYTVTVEQ